jgi:D-xylose transport system permease protein
MTATPSTAGPSDGTSPSMADTDFSRDASATTLKGAARDYVDRVRGGDMGALPAVLGLVALFIIFAVLKPDSFPTTYNMANLVVQAGAICVLAMGLVPVLLLGDIDLSAGVAGGACAAVMAVLMNSHGWSWYAAVLLALAVGAVIGFAIGALVAVLGIPSFVVTLAFFLGLQGMTLRVVGQGGAVPVRSETVVGISNDQVPVVAGWIGVVVLLLAYAAVSLNSYRVKAAANLQRPPLSLVLVKIGALSVILLVATYLLNQNRARTAIIELAGIPYVVPLVVALLVLWTFVFTRTTYGRHVYAVGGNREAARRAGINVNRIRISVFVICTTMAAVSGIIAASRLNSVTPGSGGGNTLLYAVGAAVIGGTSLFGGRGQIRDAIIGGLVIATIANGLGLLGQSAYVNFIVTGGVLLLAAGVDAVSRRRRAATGR